MFLFLLQVNICPTGRTWTSWTLSFSLLTSPDFESTNHFDFSSNHSDFRAKHRSSVSSWNTLPITGTGQFQRSDKSLISNTEISNLLFEKEIFETKFKIPIAQIFEIKIASRLPFSRLSYLRLNPPHSKIFSVLKKWHFLVLFWTIIVHFELLIAQKKLYFRK